MVAKRSECTQALMYPRRAWFEMWLEVYDKMLEDWPLGAGASRTYHSHPVQRGLGSKFHNPATRGQANRAKSHWNRTWIITIT